jgi:hypothetical protein
MFPEEEQLLNPILIHYLNQPIDAILSGEMEAVRNRRKSELSIVLVENAAPYFQVFLEKENIKAKFLIENCLLVEGNISPDDHKRIKAFYADPKSQIVLKKVWLSK